MARKSGKSVLLFSVGCFGKYEIYLLLVDVLLQIHMAINNHGYVVLVPTRSRPKMLKTKENLDVLFELSRTLHYLCLLRVTHRKK